MNRILTMVLRNWWRVPGYYAKLCRYAAHPERYSEAEMWAHIHRILEIALASGNLDMKVTGLENIPGPEAGGFMMYGNHQGMFDVVALAGTCKTPLAVVLKKELKDVPFIKQICRCTNSFAMDREDVRQSLEVIRAVTEEVKKGRNYVIFPEGTRSKNGNTMGQFHSGSFRCALKAKCPIIPFAFVDSFKVLDQKGSKPLSVQLHYLKPISYEEYKDLKTVELADLVKSRIQAVLDANT